MSEINPINLIFPNINNILKKTSSDILILTFSDNDSEKLFNQLSFFVNLNENYLAYLPSTDILPYDRVSPSPRILFQRSKILTDLSNSNLRKILIVSSQNFSLKYPHKSNFSSSFVKITDGSQMDVEFLSEFLITNGYQKISCARDSGEFSVRGDIMDIVLSSDLAYRLNFEWNKISSIKKLDTETQISYEKLNEISIYPASEFILNKDTIDNFKSKFLKYYNVNYTQNLIYENIISGIRFSGIESISPIFYDKHSHIIEFLNNPIIIADQLAIHSMSNNYNEYVEFYNARTSQNKLNNEFYPAFPPSELLYDIEYCRDLVEKKFLDEKILEKISFFHNLGESFSSKTPVQLLVELTQEHSNKFVIIAAKYQSSIERLIRLFDSNEIKYNICENISNIKRNSINIINFSLDLGVISDKYVFIPDKYLIGDKKQISSSKKKLKNILNELDNFQIGDLVVHKDHGIGRFEGIENFEISSHKHDCIKLIYAKGDKLFIPVENIDLIKRYGSENVELDYLGSLSWQKRTSKVKERIGEIAKNLINIAAKRKLIEIDPMEIDEISYEKFSNNFPYSETDDQLSAIEDVKADLKDTKPMDRLICGDVGFGKTEVAMRAAFMVATAQNDNFQVAVISPTTLLCRQHLENFRKRFKDTNIQIESISRLVTSKRALEVKKELSDGKINIIIGTHALLNDNVKFKNLGLVIIDEEQHFGVTQKEFLKKLKNSTHSLTLSATPIPRTLQMSLLGIRDLSIIATPPIDRLSVRTSVMIFDEIVIRDALMKEHFRGGRSFFVCPRIKNIEEIEQKIKKIVPELKCKIAHGQMKPSDIDEIMNDFYDGKIDVLISTTIIESGLDVPDANTIIIFKPENLGLSQLYQLRGRVGRGKLRGHAYLMTDPKKLPTNNALKRLEVMQTIDSLGAGFSIATHDMDLRGFGNLVGDEQSGHIREVGSELYNDMLEEAIAILRNEREVNKSLRSNIKINVPVFIPEDYISDGNLRLSIYRRIADLRDNNDIEIFIDEMNDRFGKIPESMNNLLEVILLKNMCVEKKITTLDSGNSGFVLIFDDSADNDKIIEFLKNNPRNTKVKPGNKLVFIKDLTKLNVIEEAKKLLNNF